MGALGVHFGAWSARGRRNPENLRTAWRDPHIKSCIKICYAWFHYGGAVFDQEALWELLGSILGPGRRQGAEAQKI